jgi:hypothetical protein
MVASLMARFIRSTWPVLGFDVGRCRASLAWRREVDSVVAGEDGMDLVGGGEQATQEVPGGPARDLLMQFNEGELRRPIDRDDEIELALSASDLAISIRK